MRRASVGCGFPGERRRSWPSGWWVEVKSGRGANCRVVQRNGRTGEVEPANAVSVMSTPCLRDPPQPRKAPSIHRSSRPVLVSRILVRLLGLPRQTDDNHCSQSADAIATIELDYYQNPHECIDGSSFHLGIPSTIPGFSQCTRILVRLSPGPCILYIERVDLCTCGCTR